jgi:TonB family protein
MVLAIVLVFACGALTAGQVPVRVGGGIKEPARVTYVDPVYPRIAQQAKVQGTVILEARIGTDGSVQDVRVLKTIALLTEAAVEAVRQWRYTPTLLNGEPVEVLMVVTVNFSLPGARTRGGGAGPDPEAILSAQLRKDTDDVTLDYPAGAFESGARGPVVVQLTVDAAGKPRNARVVPGNSLLAQAALDAVMGMSFTPALLNGRPIESTVNVTVGFRQR